MCCRLPGGRCSTLRRPCLLSQRYPGVQRAVIDGWGVDTHFMLHAFVALAVS